MEKYVMLIDRGSTNVKVVLFNTKGEEILISSYASQKPVSVAPGWWEQDMNLMWESTVKAIKGIFEKKISPESILGVYVTGQGNGLMPIDKNGNPSRMGILSLDSRSGEILGEWFQDGRYMKAVETLRLPFAVGSPLPLLFWFKKNAPKEFDAIKTILFSKDWIRFKLSNTICTDPTDASGAGLMDLKNNAYAYNIFESLDLFEITSKLPPIRPSDEVVGGITKEASLETGLKEGTPVLCGAHDLGAYPLGIGAVDPKQLVSVVGTWGFNIVPIRELTKEVPVALYHTVPGYYLTGMGDGNSGGCLDIMINNLCDNEKYQAEQKKISVHQYIEEMIENIRETSIIFHPFIFGTAVNSSASGGFYGIKNWHTKSDMLRAVYEGIVFGHYMGIQMIPKNKDFESIWLIGGGSKSKIFGQLFADITGLNVKVPKTSEITARGGALSALVGLGIFRNYEEACIPPEIKSEYIPNLERKAYYEKKYEIFCEIYQSTTEIWSKLAELNN